MTRSRGAFGSAEEVTEFGGRTELLRSPEGIVERLRIEAHRSLTLADDHDRLECVVEGPGKGSLATLPAHRPSVYQAGDEPLQLCRCIALPDPPRPLDS